MSAIRNVGELASPYYLLEVWARREEIDIDPETYASLKRKVRKLVRDARGFELRGEQPDGDWQSLRAEVLALEAASSRTVMLDDGSAFDLQVWSEPSGAEALLVGDLAGLDDPDRRTGDEADPPSTRFELALDAYAGDADWGVLLAGLQVRVYRRSSGLSQQYLGLDLDTLVELDDEPSWKAFAAMFRAPAFDAGTTGVPLIRRVVDESRRHASELAADMRKDVVDAAEAIIQGALRHPDNSEVIGEATRATLHQLFEESLYTLYRVLFVLYAEARDVLPVSGGGPYATSYSIEHLVDLARHGGSRSDGRYFHDTLRTLFELLSDGAPEITHRLGFDPVGGELFDPERTPLLGACVISDPAWERAITSVALGAPGSPRRRLGRRSSFAELGVDQLGSIYEGLLVLEPYLATEPAFLGLHKGDRRVFAERDIEKFSVLRELRPGDFVLESAGGRRKGTGSFYTPHEITEYLTHAALDPLVEAIFEEHQDDPDAMAGEILTLKVCDPAMGSGAFLVQAARVLAIALARARALKGDGLVTPDRVQHAKREVVRHCLYGVDLNPLAVALAKVSLWLETLEPGRPLSFLDAHLRCGDSLVGVNFLADDGRFSAAELASFPVNAHKGLETYLKNEAGVRGEPVLARLKARKKPSLATQPQLPGFDRTSVETALEELASERERIATLEERAETLFDVQDAQAAFEELEVAGDSIRNRLRRAADFWCAQWFSDGEDAPTDDIGPVVPATFGQFDEAIASLVNGASVPDRTKPVVDAAQQVAARRRFFHWVLEFPEVLLDRGGFDAVLGNPPWNETNLQDQEFFSTFDPDFDRYSKEDRPGVKALLRSKADIDSVWRYETRHLTELANFAKPESGRFTWFAQDGQLRKGDANVYRLFVEQAFHIARYGGRVSQVLPESVYISSPATGLRKNIFEHHDLDFVWVIQNSRRIFPIGTNIKIVLLAATKKAGPTESFRCAFFVGKDAIGMDRALSIEELPAALAGLEAESPVLQVSQIEAIAPRTLSLIEIQTELDLKIAARSQQAFRPLSEQFGLVFCRELDARGEAWKKRTVAELGLVISDVAQLPVMCEEEKWYGSIGGTNIHQFSFPHDPVEEWIPSSEFITLPSRRTESGALFMDFHRIGWRKIGRSTDERSMIATVIPPGVAARNTCLTVQGGLIDDESTAAIVGLWNSFVFDFLHRLKGTTNLTYGVVEGVPVPPLNRLGGLIEPATVLVRRQMGCSDFGRRSVVAKSPPDSWSAGAERALIDALVANVYGLSLEEYAAVLLTFPRVDRSQPMLPGEPKCFVTRDLALRAFCEVVNTESPDVSKLMREVRSGLPDPRAEYCDLDARIHAYRELGAVPYQPTPRGARPPTDPSVIEEVLTTLSDDPSSVAEIAEIVGEDEPVVAAILKQLKKSGDVYSEGRGMGTRYYRLEDD